MDQVLHCDEGGLQIWWIRIPAKAGPGTTPEREGVQAVTGADLGEESLSTYAVTA